MAQEISNYNDLYKKVSDSIEQHKNGPLILALDGGDGTGKTYIAEDLWKGLGGGIIHGDNFMTGNLKDEHEFFIQELEHEISAFRRMHSFFIVIESVLLWQALDKLKIKPDIVVYIKKISGNNRVLWTDEDELGSFNPGASVFRNQVINYHKTSKPIERADIIYLNSWHGS
jgi:hypothetical protein